MSDPKKTTPTITASEPDPNPNPAPAPKAGTSKQWKHTPPRIRVWEDQHSAEAAIVRDNEDDTLDLSADIYHTGRPIALKSIPRCMPRHVGEVVIVHGRTPDALVVDRKAARLDHVERCTEAGGKPDEGAEILRDIGLEQG